MSARQPARARGRTILLLEDDGDVRDMIRDALVAQGHEVLECSGEGEALEASRRHPGAIDLILADVMLPTGAAVETVERIARQRPGTRVLYMSGFFSEDLAARTGGLPRGPFIQKPFSIKSLVRKIRAVLEE